MPDIALKEFERLVTTIAGSGVKELDLLGGEPTLHPGFVGMLDILYSHKMKTTISTNGCGNLHVLEAVHGMDYAELIKIGVSLNSAPVSEGLHRYLTKHRPMLKSVYTRKQGISEVAKKYLVQSETEYYLLFMDVVDKDSLGDGMPFYDFYRDLDALKRQYKNIRGVFCSGFIPNTEEYPVLAHVRCPAGTTKLSVLPDGTVYPCYLFFRNREFNLGNLLVNDFYTIWNNPILDIFRQFKGNPCTDTHCELRSACHGGCPALSLLILNDINAPDPRCMYGITHGG
jgi:radical SAM protein with 4Fe4S-binding SPASM domain